MTPEERNTFFFDGALYCENRNKIPRQEWLKYAGEHVAISLDGTCILAHGEDLESTVAAMRAAGLDPERAVWDHLDPLEVDSIL